MRRIARARTRSDLCFVVMSLSGNDILESYYSEGVQKVVETFGLRCVRVDRQIFDGTITAQIRENIETARIVIIDTTEDRPNCYFEAGYAVAKNKNIIWQRLKAARYKKKKIEFDIQDYPHILYTSINDLRTRLHEKIEFYLRR